MAQIAVCGDQQVELRFRLGQQLAVAQRGPVLFVGGFHEVAGQVFSQRNRRALIEQDAHAAAGSGGLQAGRRVLEDRFRLGAGDTREPGEEPVERRTALQVLEQRAHRHARAAEDPRPA